jgi:hypothetical protein
MALLSGCAAPLPQYLSQKKENQAAIGKIQQVEIFYHADDGYVVLDLGGSSMTGLGGLLGPIGALVALAADAGSKLTMAERAAGRTKEFTNAVRQRFPGQDLNLEFAQKLAALIQETGRTVKITKIDRPTGDMLMSKSIPTNLPVTENHVPVLLRISSGYGAESATTSYRPFIKAEYVLARDAKQVYVENSMTVKDGAKTYLTYPELLADHEAASNELKSILISLAPTAYKNMFDLGELAAK